MAQASHWAAARSRHAALTLAEVLIALGVLTVGLLGVASIFPVGAHYMQTGEIADRAGAVAQAALEDAIIRGHLDPENWVHISFDGLRNTPAFNQPTAPLYPLRHDGGLVVAERLTKGLRASRVAPATLLAGVPGDTPELKRKHYQAGFYGGAYVIDPIGMAAAIDESEAAPTLPNNQWQLQSEAIRRFPASTGDLGYRVSAQLLPGTWWPWDLSPALSTWPVRRVITTRGPSPWLAGADQARSSEAAALFTSSDDLVVTLPDNGDEPARQRIESAVVGTSAPVASTRQSSGNYSWLLTVAPASDAARDAFATTPDAYPADVSAAVFYKRQVGRGSVEVQEAERLVAAQVVSTSPGGGEMLLTRSGGPEPSPFEDLRGGHYVMVVGPHPQSTSNSPRLVLRWCRVLNIQDTGRVNQPLNNAPIDLSRDNAVLVSLRGPDWPWRPSASAGSVSNDLRVAVIPGVVAVHTKTMRLGADEGLEWAID